MLEMNRKRIKVVKPGTKTSFATTEVRGSYVPPFHVSVSLTTITWSVKNLKLSLIKIIILTRLRHFVMTREG